MVRSRPANKDGVLDTADLRLIGLMITGTVPVNLAADCNQDGSVSAVDVACASAKIVAIRLNPQSYVAPTGVTFAYDESGHLIGEYNGGTSTETIYLGDLPVAILTAAERFENRSSDDLPLLFRDGLMQNIESLGRKVKARSDSVEALPMDAARRLARNLDSLSPVRCPGIYKRTRPDAARNRHGPSPQ
jgi:hypothetical protein